MRCQEGGEEDDPPLVPRLGTRTGSTLLFSTTTRFCDMKQKRTLDETVHLHRMEILCKCDVYVTFTYIYIYLQFCKCRIYTVFTPVCKHGICAIYSYLHVSKCWSKCDICVTFIGNVDTYCKPIAIGYKLNDCAKLLISYYI